MKFSIITPSYNQAEFLRQTIDSVITQEGDIEIEYFVMDGASTDNSVDILKSTERLVKNKKNISFYWQSQKDGGQVNAINQALKKCTGDIIAYINSDDYYLPKTFSRVANFFNQNPHKLWLVGNCLVSDPHLRWTFFLKHLWPIHLFKNALYVFNTINQPSVFFKKEIVKKVGNFNHKYNYAFDYDYWLRCLAIQKPGRIFKSLSVFRIHQKSKGNTGYTKQFDEDYQIFKKYCHNPFIKFLHTIAKVVVKFIYEFLK